MSGPLGVDMSAGMPLQAPGKPPRTAARREAEHAGVVILARPSDLWAGGTNLADLLDDGQVDPVKVEAAAQAGVDTLGLAVALPPLGIYIGGGRS